MIAEIICDRELAVLTTVPRWLEHLSLEQENLGLSPVLL